MSSSNNKKYIAGLISFSLLSEKYKWSILKAGSSPSLAKMFVKKKIDRSNVSIKYIILLDSNKTSVVFVRRKRTNRGTRMDQWLLEPLGSISLSIRVVGFVSWLVFLYKPFYTSFQISTGLFQYPCQGRLYRAGSAFLCPVFLKGGGPASIWREGCVGFVGGLLTVSLWSLK